MEKASVSAHGYPSTLCLVAPLTVSLKSCYSTFCRTTVFLKKTYLALLEPLSALGDILRFRLPGPFGRWGFRSRARAVCGLAYDVVVTCSTTDYVIDGLVQRCGNAMVFHALLYCRVFCSMRSSWLGSGPTRSPTS